MIPLRNDAPKKGIAYVNLAIIVLNTYVFIRLAQLHPSSVLQRAVDQWAVIPAQLWAHFYPQCITLLSALFIHGGWLHLISNMIFLYIFGGNVEEAMGHFRYFVFYLLVGVTANLGQAYLSPHSGIPMIGASGAIAGVLGSFFFFFPHARVLTLLPFIFFFTIREVPAFLFLGLWFVIQAFNGTAMLSRELITKQSLGGVAWAAHAIGFISGLICSPIFGKRTGRYR